MAFFPVDVSIPPLPPVALPPTPEVIDVPADLPALEPDVVISFPLNEMVMDMVVVPDEHDGQDVIYVAVSQERVNVWAAAVYFSPEIALGVTALVVLTALRKLWVSRRFTHRKGEAYCKKCWAGLTGVQSDTCPECGRAVRKTRRVAKRSKRSLTHPRWRWLCLALLMMAGTATLWFGESWHHLYKHGFDGQNPDDWWTLINPPDRDGPVRINQAAGWLGWYSADLAKHARENDAAWMAMLLWEYEGDEGVRFRLEVRRYATADGRLLTRTPFPAESIYQDQSDYYSSDLRLIHLSGVVLVSDYDAYYRYRFDADEPWMLYGEADPDIRHETVALTPDGRHLVFGQRVVPGGPGVRFGREISDSPLQAVVYDAETGERISLLQTSSGGARVDGRDPDVRELAGAGVPAWEVDFATRSFVPLDDGNLLLVGRYTQAVWVLNTGEVVDVPERTLAIETLRDDLWASLYFSPRPIRHLLGSPRGNALARRRAAHRRIGRAWMLGDGYLDPLHDYDTEYEPPDIMSDLYQWPTDIFLYETAEGKPVAHPSRAVRLGGSGEEVNAVRLSPDGRWLTGDMHTWFTAVPVSPVPVVIDLRTNEAHGMISEVWNNHFLFNSFVNDGRQYLASGWREVPGPPEYSDYSRHELHLYNLPMAGE